MRNFIVFANTMLLAVTFVPLTFAVVGLIEINIYKKPPIHRTATEKLWTDPSEELHGYAVKGDYLNFALYRMGAGLPSAIGAGCAVGSLNIDRYKKKK